MNCEGRNVGLVIPSKAILLLLRGAVNAALLRGLCDIRFHNFPEIHLLLLKNTTLNR
jgi:hypothetical protein